MMYFMVLIATITLFTYYVIAALDKKCAETELRGFKRGKSR